MKITRLTHYLYLSGMVFCLGVLSCGEDPPSAVENRPLDPAGKPPATGDPTVSSTDPNSAPQDTTLDVHVFGSSFDRGSRADLALDCEVECTLSEKVMTNSTRFVSSSELVANITIDLDATVDVYDVLVTTSKGKRGIGIELFAVRVGHANPQTGYTKVSIDMMKGAGSCYGVGINDRVEVVGSCYFRNQGRRAFFWTIDGGVIDLGPGYALEVSDFGGPVVSGYSDAGSYRPIVWDLGAGTNPISLPPFSTAGCFPEGRANAVDGSGDRVVGNTCGLPVLWTRTGGNWSDPQPLPLPPGYTGGQALDISTNGVILGVLFPYADGNGGEYFVWFTPSAMAERIPPGTLKYILAFAVNDNGDVAGTWTENAGWRSIFWKRNGSGWDPPMDIGDGAARGINNGGLIGGDATFDPRNEIYIWSLGSTRTGLGSGRSSDINEGGDIVGNSYNDRGLLWLAP